MAGSQDNTNVNNMAIAQTRNSEQLVAGRASNSYKTVADSGLRRQVDDEIIIWRLMMGSSNPLMMRSLFDDFNVSKLEVCNYLD
jgi:hypothetical protein